MVERKTSLALYRIFFLLSTWKKKICKPLLQGFFANFQFEFLQLLASNIAQQKCKAQDCMVWVLLEVAIPLTTTVNVFKPNTYVHISKTKDEQTSKSR
jgi:hypothetical protein